MTIAQPRNHAASTPAANPLVETVRLLPAQVALGQQVYWKDIAFAVIGAIMPLIVGLLPAKAAVDAPPIDGVPARTMALAAGISAALLFVVYNVINSAARRREQRIYKRLRCSPVPGHTILLGEAVSGAVPAILQVAVIVLAGHYWLGVDWPANWPLLVTTVVIGLIALAMLSFGISGLLPSGEIATWIVTPVLGLLMYLSGAFGKLPDVELLQRIHRYVPSAELADSLRVAYAGRAVNGMTIGAPVDTAGGFGATWFLLVMLGVWAATGLMLFNSFFRWEPRAR